MLLLEEGAILYMPTTMPGISVAEAKRVLQVSDWVLKQFPEVEYILSKAGRTETPTDPVPLSMQETVIILKPKSAPPLPNARRQGTSSTLTGTAKNSRGTVTRGDNGSRDINGQVSPPTAVFA